ncbi:MAG: bifunctional homocysteine S-methyltransferase/methylenetetrahydrofolate reductase [Deltaproteobacteria bacterium]|nr:bifunctional homocysteine S-methyltransferase/methylenetetrahydrofolate reductase [Deltaproteobacteria bacterium]
MKIKTTAGALFLDVLSQRCVLADGAMGTELYAQGIGSNRCYDELSISNPEAVRRVHQAYVQAGAEFIETNTFTANRLALAAFGLEARVRELNIAAAKLAREVAGDKAFVGGSVSPVSWTKKDAAALSHQEMSDAFAEQISALAEGGVDAIVLETFTHLDELHIAFQAARKICTLPVVCQMSLKYIGEGEFEGLQPEDVAREIDAWGADVIGVNCSDGPQGVFEAMKRMMAVTKKPLSAMPNAGLPQMVHGRLVYLATPQYFADYARRYAQLGVKLIGGCCGTTPQHIREMANFLKSQRYAHQSSSTIEVQERSPEHPQITMSPIVPVAERSPFGRLLGKKFAVSVEMEPPAGVSPAKAIEGSKILRDLGVDAINISDGARAMARMSALATAQIIKEKVGIETITHFCCRDRNILGMQMDLIGQSALGIHNLMLITGDPPKMGHYPEATAVFDVDAIGLIRFVANLNRGLDFSGRPIEGHTQFVLGCGVNPGAIDLALEVKRFQQKIEAGAEYAFSQPVYDIRLLEEFMKRIRHLPKIPFFVGVLPLYSLRNAEFLHHEVPGMQIPKEVLERMGKAASKEAQRDVGISVAREMLAASRHMDGVNGVYVFPPFRNYAAVGRLLEVIQ